MEGNSHASGLWCYKNGTRSRRILLSLNPRTGELAYERGPTGTCVLSRRCPLLSPERADSMSASFPVEEWTGLRVNPADGFSKKVGLCEPISMPGPITPSAIPRPQLSPVPRPAKCAHTKKYVGGGNRHSGDVPNVAVFPLHIVGQICDPEVSGNSNSIKGGPAF